MPMRTCKGACVAVRLAEGQLLALPRRSPAQSARRAGHRLRAPADSRSTPTAHPRCTSPDSPSKRRMTVAQVSRYAWMTSRSSSGSSCVERAVEPTRSQNITVSCRRSAAVSSEFGVGGSGSFQFRLLLLSPFRLRCAVPRLSLSLSRPAPRLHPSPAAALMISPFSLRGTRRQGQTDA